MDTHLGLWAWTRGFTRLRLSEFVQISEFFQFYITDICQTSESFTKSVNLRWERADKYRSLNKRLRTFFVNKQTLPHSFWMHGLYAKCSVSGILRIVTYPSCNWTNTRDLSQIGFLSRIRGFCVCFVQTFTQTFWIWLRFCADIWTKNWRLRPLVRSPSGPPTTLKGPFLIIRFHILRSI